MNQRHPRSHLWLLCGALLASSLSLVGGPVLAQGAKDQSKNPQAKDPQAKHGGGPKGHALAAVIDFDSNIDAISVEGLKVRLRDALSLKPKYLILKLTTGGGTVEGSEDIAGEISKVSESGVQTIAFVRKQALSGGTMIALACDRIVMSPKSYIGDVLPIQIESRQFGLDQRAKIAEKLISPVRASLLQYADGKNYPESLIRAMVDPNHDGIVRVRMRSQGKHSTRYMSLEEYNNLPEFEEREIFEKDILVRPGEILTLSSEKAKANGFAWRADISEVPELCQALALEAGLKTVEPVSLNQHWWVKVLEFCANPWIKTVLFAIGVVALLIGFASPGMGGPEVVALLAFGLAFGSSYMFGLASYIEIMLFLIGAGLIALEVFVIPGFGVTGVLGIGLVMASFLLTLQGFIIPQTQAEWDLFIENIVRTIISFSLIAIVMSITLRFLPKTGLLGGLLHDEQQESGTQAVLAGSEMPEEMLLGRVGMVHTPLRPSGEIRLGEDVLDAVSEEALIEAGVQVEIIGRRGFSVLVRRLPKELPLGKG